MVEYGKSVINGAGYSLETWSGDLYSNACVDTLCSSQKDCHCVRMINDRAQAMDVICIGDDSQQAILFELNGSKNIQWQKVYRNIFPAGIVGDEISDSGAIMHLNPNNCYAQTLVRLRYTIHWDIFKCGPCTTGFPIKLS